MSKKTKKAPKAASVKFTAGVGGRAFTAKAPGVQAFIIGCLYAASAEKPVTKGDLLTALLDAFPDRDEKKSRNLISAAPTMFRIERGLTVESVKTEAGVKGYWIEPQADGSCPLSLKAKTATKATKATKAEPATEDAPPVEESPSDGEAPAKKKAGKKKAKKMSAEKRAELGFAPEPVVTE